MKIINFNRLNLFDLTKNIKDRIVNISVIALSLIIAFNIYKGQTVTIKYLKNNRDKGAQRNEALNKIANSEKKLSFYKSLFTKKDTSTTINMINNIARKSNINILTIRPEGEEVSTPYIKYPFSLAVSTDSYHTLGKFISNLESDADTYFIDICTIRRELESPGSKPDVKQPAKTYKLFADIRLSTIIFEN